MHGTQACLSIELGESHPARALQLHDAVPVEQLFEVVELVGVTFERHGNGVDADREDLALEDVDELDHLAALRLPRSGALRRRRRVVRTVAISSSRSTEWRGSSSLILTTSISLNSCFTICSTVTDSTSTTIVIRLKCSSSAGATASEKML